MANIRIDMTNVFTYEPLPNGGAINAVRLAQLGNEIDRRKTWFSDGVTAEDFVEGVDYQKLYQKHETCGTCFTKKSTSGSCNCD